MSHPVAILSGGLSTRLRPLTERTPKALVEIAGRPFAIHQIELLRRHDLTDLVFCVGHLGEQIAAALGDGSRWGVRIRYSFDGSAPLGTGGALRQALPQLGERFFVLYGDAYLDCDYQVIQQHFDASAKLGLMTVFRNQGRWDRSNVQFAGGRIVAYDKRHPTDEMLHIDYGLGLLRVDALAAYPAGVAVDLASIYQDLLARDELAGFEVSHRFFEIGSPAGLEETRLYLERHHELRETTPR